MEPTIKYLRDLIGVSASSSGLSSSELAEVPLFIKGGFELYNGLIMDRKMIWAKPKEKTTPEQIRKQGQQIENIFKSPVVFVLNELDSWERKRYIEKSISFVVPNKQVYLPNLLIHFNDSIRLNEKKEENKVKYISPKSQCLILYHLEKSSLENISFKKIAMKIGFSTMDISRIIKELELLKLINIEVGKEKSIRFCLSGKELWNKILPLLKSPIKETWYTDQNLMDNSNFKIGGDNALSNYTMIASGKEQVCVIGKNQFRFISKSEELKNLDKKRGSTKIEVWTYDPSILSSGHYIDKLSLFLTLQHLEDERVMGALNDLINEIKW